MTSLSLFTVLGMIATVWAFGKWLLPELLQTWGDARIMIDEMRAERERRSKLREIALAAQILQAQREAQAAIGGEARLVVFGRSRES